MHYADPRRANGRSVSLAQRRRHRRARDWGLGQAWTDDLCLRCQMTSVRPDRPSETPASRCGLVLLWQSTTRSPPATQWSAVEAGKGPSRSVADRDDTPVDLRGR